MRKICFLLFFQASLIAFLFYFHKYQKKKTLNQNWEVFLDTELKFQNKQHSLAKRYAYKTSRKSESSRMFFDALNQFEQKLDSLYINIQPSTNEKVIQSTLDAMKLQIDAMDVDYYDFQLGELIEYCRSGANDYQSLKKALEWSISKTLNDLRFCMMPTCNFSLNRFHFELIKDKQQSRLYLITEHPNLNFETEVYIDDQLDENIFGNTTINRLATKEGQNILYVKVKNGADSSLEKFEYYVSPN